MTRHIHQYKARSLAYIWHGGMSSPLYAFASSGVVTHHQALLSEIRQCEAVAETVTDKRNTRSLFRFARDCLGVAPGGVWHAPWVTVRGGSMTTEAAYEMLRRAIAAGGDTLAQFHTTEAASVIERHTTAMTD